MELAIIVGGIVAIVAFVVWFVFATIKEAERKLGRELTLGEMFFGAITQPYSLVFVWLVLPEKRANG